MASESARRTTSSDAVPVLLVAQRGRLRRGFASGWDLVVPAGTAMRFWLALVFAGGRAVGALILFCFLFDSTSDHVDVMQV